MDSLLAGLENFESVWARVSSAPDGEKESKAEDGEREGASVEHTYSDEPGLTELIGLTYRNSQAYRALVRRSRGRLCRALLKLSLAENSRLKKLQTEYFLLTGDSLAVSGFIPASGGLLNAMREAYLNESESARAFLAQSEKTCDQGLKELYFDFSGAAALDAEKLRKIIARVL